MLREAAMLACVAVLFIVPLAASGELAVWSFDEPVSHLVWDEAMEGPDADGETSPGVGEELSGPLRGTVSLVVLPAALVLTAWAWARRMARPS